MTTATEKRRALQMYVARVVDELRRNEAIKNSGSVHAFNDHVSIELELISSSEATRALLDAIDDVDRITNGLTPSLWIERTQIGVIRVKFVTLNKKTLRPSKLTLASVRQQLHAVGVRIARRATGEYRVICAGDTEPGAYYTDDLVDALDTGRSMSASKLTQR